MFFICHRRGSVIRDDFDLLTVFFTQKKNVCFLVTADTENKKNYFYYFFSDCLVGNELVYNLCFLVTAKVYLLFLFRLFSWELLSVQVFINFSTYNENKLDITLSFSLRSAPEIL